MKVAYQQLESLSFSQALKNTKTPSQNSLFSSRAGKEDVNRHKSQGRLGCLMSPRARLIKRTNTSLRDILHEFEHLPSNQYVLRLGAQEINQDLCSAKNFDEWIRSAGCGEKQSNLLRDYYECGERASIMKKQIKMQANQIREKVRGSNGVLQNQLSDSHNDCSPQPSKKHKFSFSGFFDHSQNHEIFSEEPEELVTKISIINPNQAICQLEHHSSDKDQKCLQNTSAESKPSQYTSDGHLTRKETPDGDLQRQKESSSWSQQEGDKENEDPNYGKEIKGLQFSKNRRYKVTKKRRKNKD